MKEKCKKFRIFLSSTKSLPGREDMIRDVCFAGMIPVCMEAFGHDPNKIGYIKQKIESSDLVISIFGDDPGVMIDEQNTFLMFEYRHAKKSEIPVVAFVKEARSPDAFPERCEEFKIQETFIRDIGTEGLLTTHQFMTKGS